jgi:hypothetical protein
MSGGIRLGAEQIHSPRSRCRRHLAADSQRNESKTMSEFFHSILSMPSPFNMVVMVVLISCSAAVVKFVAMEIRRFGCHRQDIDFKREMVERGLSAEEIERVLAAGPKDGN